MEELGLTTALKAVMTCGTEVMTFITDNPVLWVLFCGSFVGLGAYVIRKVKGVAKR